MPVATPLPLPLGAVQKMNIIRPVGASIAASENHIAVLAERPLRLATKKRGMKAQLATARKTITSKIAFVIVAITPCGNRPANTSSSKNTLGQSEQTAHVTKGA
jgi:hypothetical protein